MGAGGNSGNGKAAFAEVLRRRILDALYDTAEHLAVHAMNNRGYLDLTGNTNASYMAGVYEGGGLHGVVSVMDTDDFERKLTPERGTIGHADADIYGWIRVRRITTGRMVVRHKDNIVDTDRRFGYDKSHEILGKSSPGGDYGIVVTTGTEYSGYLEYNNFNVLSDTELYAEDRVLGIIGECMRKRRM